MDEHSLYPPSGAHRWINCPASLRLKEELGLPDPPTSPEAVEGQNAHAQAAFALKNKTASVGDPAIDLYLDTIYGTMAKLPDSKLYIEKKVQIVGRCWGTLDAAVYSPANKELHIFDYKHGKGIFVEIEDNPQLKLYWYGMAKMVEAEKGSMTIVQPRHWSGKFPVRQQFVEKKAISKWIQDEVIPAINTIDIAKPTPGEWCRWCPAMVGCPVVKELLFGSIKIAQGKKADVLSASEAEELYQGLAFLEEYKKALEAFIAQKLTEEDFDFTARFKFIKTPRRRIWADKEGVKPFIEMLGLDPEKLYKKTLISPLQATKIFKDADLTPYIKMVGGNPKVALLTEPGEEYNKPKPEDDFSIIK